MDVAAFHLSEDHREGDEECTRQDGVIPDRVQFHRSLGRRLGDQGGTREELSVWTSRVPSLIIKRSILASS